MSGFFINKGTMHMDTSKREFASFANAVGKYKLDERDQKTTSHTSAVSVRWVPPKG